MVLCYGSPRKWMHTQPQDDSFFPGSIISKGVPDLLELCCKSPKVKSECCSVMSNSLWPHGLCSPWNSPGQNTGVDSLSLLQGIFPTRGRNSGFPHCHQIFYQLSYQGSPRILKWVAYPFSRGSSWPRNPVGVSCIKGGSFTNQAVREAKNHLTQAQILVFTHTLLTQFSMLSVFSLITISW